MSSPADAWSAVRGRPLRFLGSSWPWRSLAYLATTIPVGLAALVVLGVVLTVGVLTMVVVAGLLVLAGIPVLAGFLASVERRRLGLVLPRADRPAPTLREQLRAARRLPVAWSEVGYAALLSTVLWVVDAIAVLLLSVPVVLMLAPWLVRIDTMEVTGWRIDSTGEAWFAALVPGVLTLVLAAYVVTWVACGKAALARQLLDPPEARLAEAVADLRRSRSGLVNAFETERRRIERDLHDGVQQRLVGLTMTLGSAELEVEGGPGLVLVQRAHREAEEALAELRRTVRGIHPQVLSDHGLAAAAHEVADRSPVPVHVDLALDGRLPAPVEQAAYFFVSEALTNIARHADARSAQVHAWTSDDRLVLTVVDDGVGGADPDRGTGLAGLRARLEALDGEVRVSSPSGGPTEVRMECPLG